MLHVLELFSYDRLREILAEEGSDISYPRANELINQTGLTKISEDRFREILTKEKKDRRFYELLEMAGGSGI